MTDIILWVMILTIPVPNAGNSVVTDLDRSIPSEDKCRTIDQGGATQNKLNWVSAAYSSTKVVIDVVKESSDVFPPLKSVASGLAALLKHYDVWTLSLIGHIYISKGCISKQQPTGKRWHH